MYVNVIETIDGKGVSDKRGNIGSKVVPSSRSMFEAEKVRYRKVGVNSLNEFNEYLGDITDYYILSELPTKGEFEFVLLTLFQEEKTEYVVCSNCSMYVMNDNGKTIDSLICN